MEIWTFHHPEQGTIEVERGTDEEFRERYPSWPESPDSAGDEEMGNALRTKQGKSPLRLQVMVNGEVRRRLRSVPTGRVPLQRHVGEKLSSVSSATVHRDKPHLHIQSNWRDDILAIDYREGPDIVEFDPPPGSRGKARKQAMESSSLKRVAIPLATGLGRAGWALSVIILGPLVARLIGWLLSFLPDWELPPLPPLPQVSLPLPQFPQPPQVSLPVPAWPSISVPEPPEWVLFLLEYSKVWIPVVIGIAFGIVALRNHRRSERTKQEWQEETRIDTPSTEPRARITPPASTGAPAGPTGRSAAG